MGWERMPLYPGERRLGCGCYQIPLFGDGRRPGGEPCSTQTVRLENPCCPCECASVTLSVDACGNLSICVHRDPPRCGRDCGRRRC